MLIFFDPDTDHVQGFFFFLAQKSFINNFFLFLLEVNIESGM
jgi:hypothetical protein